MGSLFSVVTLLKPSNMTYTYDNSGHGNDDGKVNYVADNKTNDVRILHTNQFEYIIHYLLYFLLTLQ